MARYILRHYDFLQSLILFHDYEYTIHELSDMNGEQMLALISIIRRLLDGRIVVTPIERRRYLQPNPNNNYLSILTRLADPVTIDEVRKRLLIENTPLIVFILKYMDEVRQEALIMANVWARATG